mmetsp:Transcript_15064/g.33202  ORF Transcript_15064/g.33202 Transcript_15064/m.33202 type:complete len:392 (+) Transcript_15064:828-2003(+)
MAREIRRVREPVVDGATLGRLFARCGDAPSAEYLLCQEVELSQHALRVLVLIVGQARVLREQPAVRLVPLVSVAHAVHDRLARLSQALQTRLQVIRQCLEQTTVLLQEAYMVRLLARLAQQLRTRAVQLVRPCIQLRHPSALPCQLHSQKLALLGGDRQLQAHGFLTLLLGGLLGADDAGGVEVLVDTLAVLLEQLVVGDRDLLEQVLQFLLVLVRAAGELQVVGALVRRDECMQVVYVLLVRLLSVPVFVELVPADLEGAAGHDEHIEQQPDELVRGRQGPRCGTFEHLHGLLGAGHVPGVGDLLRDVGDLHVTLVELSVDGGELILYCEQLLLLLGGEQQTRVHHLLLQGASGHRQSHTALLLQRLLSVEQLQLMLVLYLQCLCCCLAP